MFIGSFKYSVDSKGRVSIPAKLRKNLTPEANDTFILTRGTAQCIDVYPMDNWKELAANKLNQLNSFDPKEAMFIRMFLQGKNLGYYGYFVPVDKLYEPNYFILQISC